MLNQKAVLITGGTGSFGKKFTDVILNKYPDIKRLVIYSRDELKQYDMAQDYPVDKFPNVRFFIGDVRDKDRFIRACEGIDVIIHTAALKHVPAAEYNPDEFIKTNINGAQNVIDGALATNVKVVVALSTDKAAAPINLYGATKLVSDKLFIAANNIKGNRDLRFSVVRYGNVMGSRGSVIPFFLSLKNQKTIPITDERMTRFMISLEQGVDLVWKAFNDMIGGEIYVKKIPSMKITDIAKVIAPNSKFEIVGIRPGEKLHEQMIGTEDSYTTFEYKDHFKILPQINNWGTDKKRIKQGKKVKEGFFYNSKYNLDWMTKTYFKNWIKANKEFVGKF